MGRNPISSDARRDCPPFSSARLHGVRRPGSAHRRHGERGRPAAPVAFVREVPRPARRGQFDSGPQLDGAGRLHRLRASLPAAEGRARMGAVPGRRCDLRVAGTCCGPAIRTHGSDTRKGNERMLDLRARTWTLFNPLLGLMLFASIEACGASSALLPVTDSGPGDDGALRCASDTDCPGATHCYFLVSDGCSATGACLNAPFTGACRSPTWCSCDGTDIVVCAPGGYSPLPIASEAICDGGGPTDAGVNH